jgi:hypothetical protein
VKGDINDTLQNEGVDGVRFRHDKAVRYQNGRFKRHAHPQQPLILSTPEFVTEFVPPDYLIDGLLQKRFLYSLTGPTGTGKTAIALRLVAHVAFGLPLAGRQIERGKVLFLAGENPDDVRMRWIKQMDEMNLDPRKCEVYWRPGALNLSDKVLRCRLDLESTRNGPFGMIVVDTSAAFFTGDEENSNVQMGKHARMLRSFVNISGGPTVLVTCHPIKNADLSNLLPRGGGAFLAEVDGNLVCVKSPDIQIVELHWHGKFRGPDFAPIPFRIETGTTPKLIDSKGRPIFTVTARPVSETEVDEADAAASRRQTCLLETLKLEPKASLAGLARKVGWSYSTGEPNKTLVNRTLQALKKAGLVKKEGDGWIVKQRSRNTGAKSASETKIGSESACTGVVS